MLPAIRREIADIVERLTTAQFRVLYRRFLLHTIDGELLSPHGDHAKLLGQFAALLVFTSAGFSAAAFSFGGRNTPRAEMLIAAWPAEHLLITTTMLVAGIFAFLSWDSMLPNRQDVHVLAALPIPARTMLSARFCASATVLAAAVAAVNVIAGIVWPLALAPPTRNLVDLVLNPTIYRWVAGYWFTMLAGGGFVFGCVLIVRAALARFLSHQHFLRWSGFVQTSGFFILLCFGFLQPSFVRPDALVSPQGEVTIALLPSYWFLGLFQQLTGSMHPAMMPLAGRAWAGLALVFAGVSVVYLVSYSRAIAKIAEQPDLAPTVPGMNLCPHFRNPLITALLNFSGRTLLRSSQHRLVIAFYAAVGVAASLIIQDQISATARPLFASLAAMTALVVGMRVVFAIPYLLKANWIFRIAQVRNDAQYRAAARWPLFVLGVLPIWLPAALFFLLTWAWRPAVGHLVVLALWGTLVGWVSLRGFHTIPFTCSWLPGKSPFHIAVLGAAGLLFLLAKAAEMEMRALQSMADYSLMLIVLASAVLVAKWRTTATADQGDSVLRFEEVPPPAVFSLELYRSR